MKYEKKNRLLFAVFFLSKYFQSSVILQIPMIASEKSHQNLSDYSQFRLKKRFEVNGKMKIRVNITMIMFTRSSERIFNPLRYTGSFIKLSLILILRLKCIKIKYN